MASTWTCPGQSPCFTPRLQVPRAETAGWPREVTLPGLPQIRTCPIQASGSSVYGFAARRCRTVTHPVVAAIFRCFVKMVSRLDVRGICPSGSSVVRPPPSLHGVPWGRFPRFTGTMQRLRRLASPRRFVAFARRCHPDASSFAPWTHGRHAPRARTISSAAPVDRVSRMESTRPPRFLGNPPAYMPRSSTPADPTTLAMTGRAMLPSAQKTASAPRSVPFRGSITRPAHALCTLRSRGHPRTTQHSVPAGAYPLPGQDFHLLGSSRKFPSCRRTYMASPLSRLCLAQFPRERQEALTRGLPGSLVRTPSRVSRTAWAGMPRSAC